MEDGVWTEYYPNKEVKLKQEYVNGLLANIIICQDSTGKTLPKGTLKEGNGTVINYSEKGLKVASGSYEEGLQTGVWTFYFENGQK